MAHGDVFTVGILDVAVIYTSRTILYPLPPILYVCNALHASFPGSRLVVKNFSVKPDVLSCSFCQCFVLYIIYFASLSHHGWSAKHVMRVSHAVQTFTLNGRQVSML